MRLRETSPGVMRIDHDPDKHDDRAIALGLACVQLLSRPSYKVHQSSYAAAELEVEPAKRRIAAEKTGGDEAA